MTPNAKDDAVEAVALERVAQAIYEAAQRENGNLSALPWSVVRHGSTAARWYAYARAAIEAMRAAHVTAE